MNAILARFLVALLLAATIGCGRKTPKAPQPPVVEKKAMSPSVAAQTTALPATPALDFAEAAKQVQPAVVIVSVFNQTGHLSANGHGFFVGNDGKFIADRSVMTGAANAVAKTADGAIYNVSGALAQNPAQNLVLLKADVRRVAFLIPSATSLPEIGGGVAVVLSPVERAKRVVIEAKISGHFSDEAGERFDVSPALPKDTLGAPVINQRGELVGIVAWRGDANGACVVRPAHAASNLLAQIGPNMIASWQTATTPLSSSPPFASPSAAKSPSPPKIAIRGSRLIYAPAPHYPQELRRSHWGARGSGSFRIVFDAQGHASGVQTLRSTGNSVLDEAALTALHEWRAQPGAGWSLIVPVTFQP